MCDVMIESDELTEDAHMVFGTTPQEAYIDLYAFIEPSRRLVTGFLMICKKENGTDEQMKIEVSSLADSVEYYRTLEYQGGTEFKDFIRESCNRISSVRMADTENLIEIVEDMLKENAIRLPNSDKEMEENDALPYEVYWNDGRKTFATYNEAAKFRDRILPPNCGAGIQANPGDCGSVIYGSDYSKLSDALEDYLKVSKAAETRDRLQALNAWAMEYNPDELDFYTELSDEFTLEEIIDACGIETGKHVKEFWDEHGLIGA